MTFNELYGAFLDREERYSERYFYRGDNHPIAEATQVFIFGTEILDHEWWNRRLDQRVSRLDKVYR